VDIAGGLYTRVVDGEQWTVGSNFTVITVA